MDFGLDSLASGRDSRTGCPPLPPEGQIVLGPGCDEWVPALGGWGWDPHLHTAVDDHSRLACSEPRTAEKKEPTTGFWQRAHAFSPRPGSPSNGSDR
jgi:hypothetical protein